MLPRDATELYRRVHLPQETVHVESQPQVTGHQHSMLLAL